MGPFYSEEMETSKLYLPRGCRQQTEEESQARTGCYWVASVR